MSRLGKLPVAIPASVSVNIADTYIAIKGPKGELKTVVTGDVSVTFDEGNVWVKPANDTKRARAMWGTVRSNVNNIVQGVTTGFKKELEINGVGFRSAVAGNVLTLFLGFSHEIKYIVPEGIDVKCEKPTLIVITGACKQRVGQVAAEIRALRKPEPYKGKGVRYVGEYVRIKEGKKK
jgi:large subunit ribosomal protein L6